MLEAQVKKWLLKLARATLNDVVLHNSLNSPNIENIPVAARAQKAAFVTLTIKGSLRGCIGQILPTVELWQTIQTHTINAAMHDTRFDRLETRELPLVKIEISVLTPPIEIAAWQDIQLGHHGVILTKNYRSAVFLPHVATEQGWTLSETLDNLARKAGLASNAWQQGANLQVFEAELFGE